MNARTDIQMMIVRQLQQDRRAAAEARRLTRRAPRPPARDARRHATHDWPRRVLALFRLPAWG